MILHPLTLKGLLLNLLLISPLYLHCVRKALQFYLQEFRPLRNSLCHEVTIHKKKNRLLRALLYYWSANIYQNLKIMFNWSTFLNKTHRPYRMPNWEERYSNAFKQLSLKLLKKYLTCKINKQQFCIKSLIAFYKLYGLL